MITVPRADGPRISAPAMGRQIAAIDESFREYAIESSISKVYEPELLDFVVDEAVQIIGGYGFTKIIRWRGVSRFARQSHLRGPRNALSHCRLGHGCAPLLAERGRRRSSVREERILGAGSRHMKAA